MAKNGPNLIDHRLAKAFENPIRGEILTILRDGPSSPARIQRRLENVSLNLVSHHIKVLKELGCISLRETVAKRGAREHVYEAVGSFIFPAEEWETLTPKMRQPITMSILRMTSRDLARSLSTGRFEEIPDNHLSRSVLNLDQEGWKEAADLLARTLDELLAIGDRSLERVEAGDEDSTETVIAIMQFPTSPS